MLTPLTNRQKKDIEQNYKQNQWRNFTPNDEHYQYYMSKRAVYNEILGKLLAQDEKDAIQFMRDHFTIVHIS